ncbi:hypothetical protein D779_0776 [Imhoffiella purpurea]|uniref:Uncharacterized protein n=1 Tax=Imhoffiella purpurea TaxID=1249627 RepID=W9VIN3_9GAMM|nr:hypothetical protein D779_0776 [Imhoffiella purpurea]
MRLGHGAGLYGRSAPIWTVARSAPGAGSVSQKSRTAETISAAILSR